MTYDHLQADCLYTRISSGPNAWYQVWEAFTFTFYVVDTMWAMIIVWRISGIIIRTVLCCVVYDSCTQWYCMHTCEQFLKMSVDLVFMCLFRFTIFCFFSSLALTILYFCCFCFCSVGFSFFSIMPRDWLGRTSPKWVILCPVERKTLSRWINFKFMVITDATRRYWVNDISWCCVCVCVW